MKFNLISLIYFFGALQALLLMIGINLNKPLHTPLKKVTTLLLSAILLVTLYYIVIITKFSALYPYTDSLGTAAWMSICPLYYLLCRSLLDPKWSLQWKYFLFFPITIIFSIEGLLTTLGLTPTLYTLLNRPQLFLDLWIAIFFGTSTFFILRSIRLIRQPEKRGMHQDLLVFSYLFLGILVFFSVFYLMIRQHYNYAFEYVLIALFEVLIFILVYRLFKGAPFQSFFQSAKYPNKILSTIQLEQLAQQLAQKIEQEQAYLDKKLSLDDLAKLSDIPANDLSQLFNVYYQSNFYEYLNGYRLQHLEQLLLDPQFAQFKISALAEQSGFNSKATFYKAFKEKHQLTPSQYIKKHRSARDSDGEQN